MRVANAAPTASVSGPATGATGTPVALTLTATDPSPEDASAGFRYRVLWSDGVLQFGDGPSTFTIARTFAAGTYTARVEATDKDGGTNAQATHVVTVEAVAGVVFQGGILTITGTSGNDIITVSRIKSGELKVKLNGVTIGPFRPARVVIHSLAGNDTASLVGARAGGTILAVTPPVAFFGGPGDDSFEGGHGTANNVLVGGDGRDRLRGGTGRDIVFGGLGVDTLDGNGGDDVLVGGTTVYDDDLPGLDGLMAEWGRAGAAYRDRVARLSDDAAAVIGPPGQDGLAPPPKTDVLRRSRNDDRHGHRGQARRL